MLKLLMHKSDREKDFGLKYLFKNYLIYNTLWTFIQI
jgi:hypothetical protein